jgi:NAD(P)H-hydrate epimerase
MNPKPLTCEQVRQVDQIAIDQYAMPGIVLMENAGRGAAEKIDSVSPDGLATILCGKGNNGGDGYVVARHLQLMGRPVQIISVTTVNGLTGDARINAEIAARADLRINVVDESSDLAATLSTSAVIVDGLLGTGAKPPLHGIYAKLVQAANQQPCMRIALDIPTGMDGDTGHCPAPTFQADHTMTFVAKKIGFEQPAAAEHLGHCHVISIGVPMKLLRQIS